LEKLFQARLSESVQGTGMRLLELKMKNLPIFEIWNNAQVHYGTLLALRYGTSFDYLRRSGLPPVCQSRTEGFQIPSQPEGLR